MAKRHLIFLNGNVAICPKCSGMLMLFFSKTDHRFRCNDCGSVFVIISQSSYSNRAFICKESPKIK